MVGPVNPSRSDHDVQDQVNAKCCSKRAMLSRICLILKDYNNEATQQCGRAIQEQYQVYCRITESIKREDAIYPEGYVQCPT